MRVQELTSGSPDTPAGSRTKDLNLGKLWLCRELRQHNLDQFDIVYILGSWYGSMAPYLIYKHIGFNLAINIDLNPKNVTWTQEYVAELGLDRKIITVTQDCNQTQYPAENLLVINTSTNDISGYEWFEHIPTGTTVALQGRGQQPDNPVNQTQTLAAFDSRYPLAKTLLLDQISLIDANQQPYDRFMKIGIK